MLSAYRRSWTMLGGSTPVAAPEPHRAGSEVRSKDEIAEWLRQAARLLAAQSAYPFRIGACCHAADVIERLEADIRNIAGAGGHAALETVPGVGPSIAGAVAEALAIGRWGFLERLKGAADPEALFCSVPGIGAELAHRIQETRHLNSLETLETAARDDCLQQVPGFAQRRAVMVRSVIVELLSRIRPPVPAVANEPSVWKLQSRLSLRGALG